MTLDPVREKFVQEYHQHGNASEAYRKAKPRSKSWKPEAIHVNASKLLSEAKVQLRLSELQRMSAEKHDITIETITQMLKEDRELARQNVQSSAAVSAVMGLAKVHGLIVDKNEITGKDGQALVPVLNVTIARDQS
jgi:phage terminase small subunit